MSNTKSASVSFPIFSILLVAFIIMKLAGIGAVAHWSWWWVLSPLWIPIALILGFLAVAFLVAWVLTIYGAQKEKKRQMDFLKKFRK